MTVFVFRPGFSADTIRVYRQVYSIEGGPGYLDLWYVHPKFGAGTRVRVYTPIELEIVE